MTSGRCSGDVEHRDSPSRRMPDLTFEPITAVRHRELFADVRAEDVRCRWRYQAPAKINGKPVREFLETIPAAKVGPINVMFPVKSRGEFPKLPRGITQVATFFRRPETAPPTPSAPRADLRLEPAIRRMSL